MPDLRQTSEYAHFLTPAGWQSEKIGQGWAHFRKLPLTPFSIAKYQRPDRPDMDKYLALARKHRALKVYFEPVLSPAEFTPGVGSRVLPKLVRAKEEGLPRGWKLSRSPFLPSKTLEIDLTPPLAQIKARMKKDARYGIRKAVNTSEVAEWSPRRREVSDIERSSFQAIENVKLFRTAWQRACLENSPVFGCLSNLSFIKFLSFLTPNPPPTVKTMMNLSRAFGNKAIFLTAAEHTPGGQMTHRTGVGRSFDPLPVWELPLAGAIILITGKTAYYYRAFTTREGRKRFAQYLIVWEAIRLAKKSGCRTFDFEGVYDARFPVNTWKGFSHFKKSFGGKEIEYPGCFTTTPRRVKRGFG